MLMYKILFGGYVLASKMSNTCLKSNYKQFGNNSIR